METSNKYWLCFQIQIPKQRKRAVKIKRSKGRNMGTYEPRNDAKQHQNNTTNMEEIIKTQLNDQMITDFLKARGPHYVKKPPNSAPQIAKETWEEYDAEKTRTLWLSQAQEQLKNKCGISEDAQNMFLNIVNAENIITDTKLKEHLDSDPNYKVSIAQNAWDEHKEQLNNVQIKLDEELTALELAEADLDERTRQFRAMEKSYDENRHTFKRQREELKKQEELLNTMKDEAVAKMENERLRQEAAEALVEEQRVHTVRLEVEALEKQRKELQQIKDAERKPLEDVELPRKPTEWPNEIEMNQWAMSAIKKAGHLPNMKDTREIKAYALILPEPKGLSQCGRILLCAVEAEHTCVNSPEEIPNTGEFIAKFINVVEGIADPLFAPITMESSDEKEADKTVKETTEAADATGVSSESEPAAKAQRRQEQAPSVQIKEELNSDWQVPAPATPPDQIGVAKVRQTARETAEEQAVPVSEDEEPKDSVDKEAVIAELASALMDVHVEVDTAMLDAIDADGNKRQAEAEENADASKKVRRSVSIAREVET